MYFEEEYEDVKHACGHKRFIWICEEADHERHEVKEECRRHCREEHQEHRKHCRCEWSDWHERGERMHTHEDCCCKRDHCKGCVCERLKNLAVNTAVTLVLKGRTIFGEFRSFNRETCCVTLRVGTVDTTVDCRDAVGIIL